MDFLAHIAQTACQHEFHLRVDILDALLDDEFAAFADGVDVFEFRQKQR